MYQNKKIALIVALSENNVIGVNNTLPWHLPNDLRYFKRVTLGKPIIMGRKTFDSIGRPLPGRQNIILSRQQNPLAGLVFSDTLSAASSTSLIFSNSLTDAIEQANGSEVMIIGGGALFEAAFDMNIVDELFLTRVHATIAGDIYFPSVDLSDWRCLEEEKHEHDLDHAFSYTFSHWVK